MIVPLMLFISNASSAQIKPSTTYDSAENFSFKLSTEAQDAIQNGVAISFRCLFAKRQTIWFIERSSNVKEHRFSLMRHALSNRYIVKQDELDTPHIFRSLAEANNYIAVQTVLLLEHYNDSNNSYSLRLSLNKFDLPGPMRLNAFLSNAWDFDTGWILW
jgi:hypothetical protein